MIQSEKLSFKYEADAPPVLTDLDVSIQAGEFVAVLGPNGSGKSTMARHLNALLVPTGGTLHVNGLLTSDEENTWPIRSQAGMVFQNPDNQLVASVVEEDVAFGPENLGVPPAEIRARVDEVLAAVGMTEYAPAPPHALSGGQKQRVAIAGVLAMRPAVIVLDEPTAMLDPRGRREVLSTITKLNRENGITVILITHFMEEAAAADRVIIMKAGQIEADGEPRSLFSQVEYMRSLGLSVPAVTKLSNKLNLPCCLTVEELVALLPVRKSPPSESFEGGLGENFSKFPPKISLQSLTHTYSPNTPLAKTAIRDINLQIAKGEIVAIIGHTGSGKSTLIQHLNALLLPTAGQVFLDGADINADKKNLKSIRGRVGLVFQYPEHQLFETTVYKDVQFGPTRPGFSEQEIEANTRDALATVGLGEETWQKSPFDLSGGQKRRAAIAGVLAMRPEVLVLDEPAAGLDPQGRAEILWQIREMHRIHGITVILISHSMDDAARLATRIIVMNDGEICMDGTPREIFARGDELREIGLDVPQVAQVTGQLGLHGIFDVEEAAEAIAGLIS